MNVSKYERYLLPTITLLTLVVFAPVLGNDFINFDDPVFVTMNPAVQQGITFDSIRWAFTSDHESNWIPLTWLSHMLDVQLFGLNPAGHHGVNLLLHVASTGLLFLFLRRTTQLPWQSATVALLFGLHPLHVESVSWVAERKDVLSAFFWMSTLNAYARYVDKPAPTRYLLVIALFTLGLLAKSMVVTLPLVLLLLDYWPLCRLLPGAGAKASPWRLVSEKIPLLLLSAGVGIVTYLAHQTQGSITESYTFAARTGKAAIATLTYLHKMVWPEDLAVIYPFSLYPPSTLAMMSSALLLFILTGITLWQRKTTPCFIMGWCWYLITLLPVSGLIHIGQHSMADRYTYLPLIGIFIMIAFGIPSMLEGWRLRNTSLGGIAMVMLGAMIVLTFLQLRHWRNSITLFTHATKVTHGNWVAHNNLGQALLESGRGDEAIPQFIASIRAKPSYDLAFMNLGLVHYRKGDFQQALNFFSQILVFNPRHEEAHLALGTLHLKLGQKGLALAEYNYLKAAGSVNAEVLWQEIAGH